MVEAGVSYFGTRDLRHVRADLAEMAEDGCSYVVHCLSETDLLYYRVTMAGIMAATREAGLEAWVDPWGVAGIFSGETLSRFLIDHPETLQVRSDGRPAPAACPNHPETRRFLLEWVVAAAEAGGQVTFWDEPHFDVPIWRGDRSGHWACRCNHCQDGYLRFAGGVMPKEMDEQVRAFREQCLLDLLTELSAAARKQGMRNALCLLPADFAAAGLVDLERQTRERLRRWASEEGAGAWADEQPWLSVGVRDWGAAAAIPDLDIFGCDPYWYIFNAEPSQFTRAFTRQAVAAARTHGREMQVWVQAFGVPEGREEELALGLRVAVEEGATHVAAWSYRATESMSHIRCARPDVAWKIIGETFRSLRDSPFASPAPRG